MNYRLKIKAVNKMFIIKDRPVRSPFECIVTEDYLKIIQSRIKFYGLLSKDYEIELIDENINENQKKDYSFINQERKVSKKTIEERRVSNIKVVSKLKDQTIEEVQPKQKIIKKEERVHKKQEPSQIVLKNIEVEKKKITRDLKENREQIINNIDKVDNVNLCEENDLTDVEVKIEELTVKSSTILEKIMKGEF